MTGSTLLIYISSAILLQVVLLGAASLMKYRAAGKPLATSYPPATPHVLNAAWSGWREFRVSRKIYEDAQQSQCSFYLEPVNGRRLPDFKPGQYLTFQLAAHGQILTRCYSLSDRPTADHYRITVKRQTSPRNSPDLPPGLASNHLHSAVNPGDILQVLAPTGAFFLDPDAAQAMVLVAGGIGITPMLSMLLWCADEQPTRTIYVYYGVRHGSEHVFKRQLKQLADAHPNFYLTVAYSQPGPQDVPGRDFQHHGHVDIDLLKNTLPHGHHQFYICGPAPMMQGLVPALADWGVAPADIHFEAFGPASVRSIASNVVVIKSDSHRAADESHQVQFLQSARTFVWTAASGTLLDFAEQNGVRVESGCRAGSCGACQTQLVAGSVRYANKPDYDVAAGNCLLCVGTPSTDLVLAA